MKILVTGGRHYSNRAYLYKVLDELRPTKVVNGACPTGADRFSKDWATHRCVDFQDYPADWKRYGNAAGPIRNSYMLAAELEGLSMVVAFPGGDGTADMVKKAGAARVHVEKIDSLWLSNRRGR